MAQIAGSAIGLEIREAGTTGAFMDVVCELSSSASGSANVTTEVTKCGNFSTVAAPIYTFTVEGIAELGGDTGVSTISIYDLLQYFNSKTLLEITLRNPMGEGGLGGIAFGITGEGYITELSVTAPAEGNVSFTASFQLTGEVDTMFPY